VRASSSPASDRTRLGVRVRWPFRAAWLDVGWAVFSAINVAAIFVFPIWVTIPIQVTTQADKERLGLAIDALLENAVRHTGDGDVIKLSVMAAGAGPVRMVVSDAGQGIPDEQLRHIFDRFRSGDSGHPRGTGLGLALVRAVARAHGGDVLVRSRPGQGSEFELLLGPASPAFPAGMTGVVTGGVAETAGSGGKLARTPWREPLG
jgi:K+-sensing histidine kinase KdpD